MEFTAELIAGFLEGEIAGDKDAKVWTVAKIEEGEPGALAFLSNPKYEHFIYDTNATIVIVNKNFQPKQRVKATLIKVADAYASFAKLLELYAANRPQKTGISPKAYIHESAKVGQNVYIGEFAVIEAGAVIGDNSKVYPQAYVGDGVKIGENTIIYPGVKIYEQCVLGNNVIVHASTVIGADGFGFAPKQNGEYDKIPQLGNVVIEDWVEIGANVCIDRATMGSTIIKRGVKLDNLIQIGHNVQIGENTVAASQTGIAGSTKIGKNCMFGGQVGIVGHLTIADKVQIASQSGIGSSVKKEGEVLMGSPAFQARDHQRAAIAFKSLPEMRQQLAQLQKEVERLKKLSEEQ